MKDENIEVLQPTDVISPDAKLNEKADVVIRDKKGRFLPGSHANRKGKPKGSGFADVIAKVFEEASANGITYEEFAKKMIINAYNGDQLAMRFIMDKTPKPKAQLELGTPSSFQLYDLSKENLLEDSEEEDEDDNET